MPQHRENHRSLLPVRPLRHAGTRNGAELLADAFQEMLADNKREKKPTRAGAYTSKVTFEEFTLDTIEAYSSWRRDARTAIHDVWQRGDFLLWVTGNHLGVLPVYDELVKKNVVVIQFDAHLDIYNLADCTEELSHGNFLLHVDGQLLPVVNVGHRELLLRPEYIARYYRQTYSAAELALDPEPALLAIQEMCADAESVFLDLDCDVFDPAYFPAVRPSVADGPQSPALPALPRRRLVAARVRFGHLRIRSRPRPQRPEPDHVDVADRIHPSAPPREKMNTSGEFVRRKEEPQESAEYAEKKQCERVL